MAIGFLGIGYFRNYHGDLIPFHFLWFLLSFGILAVGIFLPLLMKTKKEKRAISDSENKMKLLKEKGEKIILNLDSCEFKTNNFQEIIESQKRASVQMYDSFYNENYNYKTEDRNQTIIIYSYKTEKFISQIIQIDEITIESRVMQKLVVLYIDRSNRSNYYFEIGSIK